jgi:hypothetical protein
MAGQVNSWMEQINISPVPCIGDTVRKVSSTSDIYTNGDGGVDINGVPTEECAFPWLWLVVALGAGYLLKGRRH